MLPSYHPHQDKSAFVKGSEISVNDVTSVKEYSCMQGRAHSSAAPHPPRVLRADQTLTTHLSPSPRPPRQGLVAVDKRAMQDLPKIREAMKVVQEEHAPTFT
eukprot:scaffold123516_cov60-Phaeocystis_antarctica.AAC.2